MNLKAKKMKIKTRVGVLLLMITTVFACDALDELTEIDITDDFETTINIIIPETQSSEPQTFNQSTSVNLSTNQEIINNIELIQNIKINSIVYEINNFVGAENAEIVQATLNFETISFNVGTVNLQQADNNNTIFTLEDATKLNDIGDILKNNTTVSATFSGTVNNSPVTFDVIINLDLTVTIDVV